MNNQFTLSIATCPHCGGNKILQPDPDTEIYECSDCKRRLLPEQIVFVPIDRTRKNANIFEPNNRTIS
jgi:DNA-directed RNA polymerase subunit RPC12/RpoP